VLKAFSYILKHIVHGAYLWIYQIHIYSQKNKRGYPINPIDEY